MLILSILLLLSSISVAMRRDKCIHYSRCSIIIYIYITYIAYNSINYIYNNNIGLFGGLFHVTTMSTIFQLFIYFICFIISHITSFYPRKLWTIKFSNLYKLLKDKYIFNLFFFNIKGEQYKISEQPLILLFILTGASFLISSSDIVSIFLSIELQSYGLYLLCTLYRNSELSTSAGLIYFLLGGLSSCFILLGTSFLYTNTGTTSLDGFYLIANLSDIKNNVYNIIYWYSTNYINFSLLIMLVGFLFKIGAAPFHFWSPDVYDAIPTIITTFVAIIAKISILIFLLEIICFTSNYISFNFNWNIGLLFSSLLSLIIGTVLGLNQSRIKRLFAYSTISHLGFMLLALSISSMESIQAFLFYLIQYSLSNLNAFLLLIVIGYSLYLYINNDKEFLNLPDKNNSPIQLINQLKGYFNINPIIAISLTLTIYSLIGIPPLIGFFGKQMVLSSALDKGYIFLVLIAILTSVISAVYYLNVIKQIFFENSDYKIAQEFKNNKLKSIIIENTELTYELKKKEINVNIDNIKISSNFSFFISYITLIIILFIFNPEQWLSITNILAIKTFN